ncbi:MAG: 5-Nucleotidase domain protein, partial [Actinobacteria bacterium]|nr:5-Nucleotidase domain protein [Actinomycetota bacterium]
MNLARSMYRRSSTALRALVVLAVLIGLAVPIVGVASPAEGLPANPVSFTILHTNDFHGQLEASGSNPGAARTADVINDVRTAVGPAKVLLFDAGDEMQGSLLSNLQQGAPTIAYFNAIGYNAATFGNHEFDWGQTVLGDRMTQAAYPFLAANVVLKDGADCASSGWTSFGDDAYQIFTIGTAPDEVKVGVIGVTTIETPYITIAEATDGLCFKDPTQAILHYYDEIKAQADVMVVLSHNGRLDGGYGYGFPVLGDQSIAKNLINAGKPVDIIIGGHSHTDMTAADVVTVAGKAGTTYVAQAHYNGRKVGRFDLTVGPGGITSIAWSRLVVSTSGDKDPAIDALVTGYASNPDYQALINQPVGYTQMDLMRNYEGDAIMGDFVDDAIYGYLNEDAEPANDVDLFLNNPGGIRTDWCDVETSPGVWGWATSGCTMEGIWAHDPLLLTYGNMFTILPFGNATVVGDMTGAAIYDLLQQAAGPGNGRLQPSGIRYKVWEYKDPATPDGSGYTYGWGAYDIEVYDKAAAAWLPLDMDKVYKVGTNEFLAPAGQDLFTAFKYMTNVTYWGDMLNAVNAYVAANYTFANPYKGPDGDGTLDGRITKNGDGDYAYEPGEVVPLTILHHNDSHGNLLKGAYVGYTQLVTLINQERAHNPLRTLLLSSGDNIQGDAMMYYFKSAGLGYAADMTPLPADLRINPLIKAFNAVGYDAMTLGNHEFNFGTEIFSTLGQANFPILQANLEDTGEYGIAGIPVEPFVEKVVGPEFINVA